MRCGGSWCRSVQTDVGKAGGRQHNRCEEQQRPPRPPGAAQLPARQAEAQAAGQEEGDCRARSSAQQLQRLPD